MPQNMEDSKSLSASEGSHQQEHLSTIIAFYGAGMFTYICFFVLLAGAEDILASTQTQTSMVLLNQFVPYTFTLAVVPFFAMRIPYTVRVAFGCLCVTTGFLIVGLTHSVKWNLFGITVESFGIGIIDVSIISLCSYFGKSVSAVYSAGTGTGCLVGPLYYTGI